MQLTQRFIDRRTSVLIKHLREDEVADVRLEEDGGVLIAGELIGRLDGFRFTPDPRAAGDGNGPLQARMVRTAAMRGLESEFLSRAYALAGAPDADIHLSEHGKFWWDGAIVAHLTAGASPLDPQIVLVADELLKGAPRLAVQTRLDAWMAARLDLRLEPLIALARAAEARAGSDTALPAQARGLAHQLVENFGALDRARLALPEKLGPILRALKPFGVWFGRRTVYLPRLLRPDAAGLLILLWGIWTKQPQLSGPPAPGLTSFATSGEPSAFLHAAGFAMTGDRAIRFDMLERLESELEKATISGADAAALLPKLVSLLGTGNDEAKGVLAALGWRLVEVTDAPSVWRKAKEKRPKRPQAEKRPPTDSPFAGLKELIAR
jgi:ATP-dependent RNA helicase SUPV3L1/SUV3